MKVKSQNSKFKIAVILLLIGFGSSAFGAAITESGSDEFNVSGSVFSGAELSDEVIVLQSSPEVVWSTKINEGSGTVFVDSGNNADFDLASDGNGGAFVTWVHTADNPYGEIYVARVNSAGGVQWRDGITVGTDPQTSEAPRIVKSTKDGLAEGAIVVWRYVYNKDVDGRILAAKYNMSGGDAWSTPTGYRTVCDATNHQSLQQLVSDDNSGAYFTWRDYRDGKAAIFAQRFNAGGTAVWTDNGVTVCASSVGGNDTGTNDPRIAYYESEGILVAWDDERDAPNPENNIYVMRVREDGSFSYDPLKFPQDGKPISTSNGEKTNLAVTTIHGQDPGIGEFYLPIFTWKEEGTTDKAVYAQYMSGGGTRNWGNTGSQIASSSLNVFTPQVTYPSPGDGLSRTGDSIFSCIVEVSAGDYRSFVQLLNVSGEAQWATGGKDIGMPGIYALADDGNGGAYAAAKGESLMTPIPYAQRIDASGNELWGADGLRLSSSAMVPGDEPIKVVRSENPGAIICWVQATPADIYCAKAADLYSSSGTYTTEKIENTDVNFDEWDTLSWVSSGSGSVSAQVKTASSSSGLDSASWSSVANGGSIPDSGNWIQAKFSFAPDAGRENTPVLSSLTFNYTTVGTDVASPVIDSFTVGGVKITPDEDYPVPESPTIDLVITDDRGIAGVDVRLDGSSIDYTRLSSAFAADTRWEIRIQPTITIGDHTLTIRVTDVGDNITSTDYSLVRSSQVQVQNDRVGVLAAGNDISVGYTLTASAKVTVEIRDITGALVQTKTIAAGDPGGVAGYNEVSIEAGALGKGVYLIYVRPVGAKPSVSKFRISQ